jgi:hypothetical protein
MKLNGLALPLASQFPAAAVGEWTGHMTAWSRPGKRCQRALRGRDVIEVHDADRRTVTRPYVAPGGEDVKGFELVYERKD